MARYFMDDQSTRSYGDQRIRGNDRTVVVPATEPLHRVADALKERRFEVVRMPCDTIYCLGGPFRCAHQPLIRL